jgi:hypothetical protein
MSDPTPDPAERLKSLLRSIMVESDPEEYDREAAEIWLTVEELERQREKKAA